MATCPVQGARIYYEAHGSGPVLLMLSGGSGDADGFGPLVPYLSKRFTVVTYDRRGYARSPLDGAGQAAFVTIETQSDDAQRVASAVSAEPAYVFGSSLGAVIGLDMAARYAERVRVLVAHEPPLLALLTAEQRVAATPTVREGESVMEALQRFTRQLGISAEGMAPAVDPQRLDAQKRDMLERRMVNATFFLQHEVAGVEHYLPDFDRLKASSAQIVIAGGEAGRAYSPYVMAQRAAKLLGTPLVEFPGHHVGYFQYPQAFAQQLTAAYDLRR